MIWIISWWILAALTAPVCLFTLRLLVFAAASPFRPPTPSPEIVETIRFLVLIPAHNEEHHLSLSVRSALAQDYDAALREVVVLADNCNDSTARIAEELGAAVLERNDPDRPGKHHALDWFIKGRDLSTFDALVILDADTKMDPGYLKALGARLASGALAVQGYNGVLNPDDTMFTRLTYVTNTMKNRLYYAGKSALGLSVPLMNGMALSSNVLAREGLGAETVAEDFETYLRLAGQGVRVAFVSQVRVLSLKATGFDEAYEQRLRWSAGQSQVTRNLVPRMIATAIRERSLVLLDAALDLAAPGYATLTGACALLLAVSLALPDRFGTAAVTWLLTGSLAALALNFIAGLALAGPTPARVASVFLAPAFIAWKAAIALRGLLRGQPGRWVRGAR